MSPDRPPEGANSLPEGQARSAKGAPVRLARPPEGANSLPGGAQPLIGIGHVRHHRLRPVDHRFAYPSYFLLLPLRSLARAPSAALRRNRFGLVSFHDADHGDGGPDCLAWLDGLLRAEGVADAAGEVWLQCFPRVLGHAFKPVSFWYCHRLDGSLAAIVAEVNNTFGERHCYLLAGPRLAWGAELQAEKVFHVSPFCRVEGSYRFRFLRTDLAGHSAPPRSVARVDYHDAQGPLLRTSISGTLQPLTARSLRAAFWRMPLMTLGVVVRIHWQALHLWRRRLPWTSKPEPPGTRVSR